MSLSDNDGYLTGKEKAGGADGRMSCPPPLPVHLTSSEAQGRRGTVLSSESPLNSWSEGGGAMWRGTWNAPCIGGGGGCKQGGKQRRK